MSSTGLLCLAAGVGAGLIGGAAILRQRRAWPHWSFLVGMLALAAESICAGRTLGARSPVEVVDWESRRMLAESFLPGAWLLFSLTYSRGNARENLRRWSWVIWAACSITFLAALTVSGIPSDPFRVAVVGDRLGFKLTWPGVVLTTCELLAAVLIVMNLESTFRASIGTMRWRIKFVILGLGVLFAVRIYTISQTLLLSTEDPALNASLRASALLVACCLIGWSRLRSDFGSVDVYPSGAFLRGSVTLLLTGIYFTAVGVLAKVFTLLGHYGGFPVNSALGLTSLVLLALVLLSDRVRQRVRGFISRHFDRPLHDYRQVWTAFVEQTSSLLDETSLCRESVKLISGTFQVLSVTIWLIDEKEELIFAASSALSERDTDELLKDQRRIPGLVDALRAQGRPINIEQCQGAWVEALKSCSPQHFPVGGNRLLLPLAARTEVLGLVSLGDRVNALPWSSEDLNLLKCIGEQIAGSVLNLQLSRKLMRAKELEAFQAMSAFFVHDLKNTAHSLTLLLQNFRAHFQDPEFRDDAQRAVANSVGRLNEIIRRLGLLRQKLEISPSEVDLNSVVTSAVEGTGLSTSDAVIKQLQPVPRFMGDSEQMQKVVTNLLLNANEAGGQPVEISTSRDSGWVVLSVRDHGCGMTREFMRKSLFQPFQTTKKTGIGIGMYHSRMIVEAHRGKIEVESAVGQGTTFRVFLPAKGN